MKRVIIFSALAVLTLTLRAQDTNQKSVIIGSYIEKPNALLALNPPEGNQGFLVPQLTTPQRLSIAGTPSDNGLIVFDITTKSFFYWKDTKWVEGLGNNALNQSLNYNELTHSLSLSNGESVDLSLLKEIPNENGNSGKFLTTDGSSLSWAELKDEPLITKILAGNGLSANATTGEISLSVQTDNTSITVNPSNEIALKDGAVTGAKLAPSAVQPSHINSGGNNKVLGTNAAGQVLWKDESSFQDQQTLNFNTATNQLTISNSLSSVNLTALSDMDKTSQSGVLVGSAGNISGLTGTTNGQVVKWNGTSWTAGTDLTAIVLTDAQTLQGDGTTTNPLKVRDNSITATQLADNSVDNTALATSSVGADEIAVDAVGASELANNAVDQNTIQSAAVTPSKILSGGNEKVLVTNATGVVVWDDKSNLDNDEQALTITGNSISISNGNSVSLNTVSASGQVTGPLNTLVIANNSITSAKIVDNTIGVTDINSGGNNKVLTTSPTGVVAWDDKANLDNDEQALALTGNSISISNGNSVSLNTVSTSGQVTGPLNNLVIADNAISSAKILDNTIGVADINSGGNNKVLTTSPTGVVAWDDKANLDNDEQALDLTGNSISISHGNSVSLNTVSASGQVTGPLNNLVIADNSISSTKIADNTVGVIDINSGGNNKVLTTSPTGVVAWDDKANLDNDEQALALTGNSISISNGNSVSLNAVSTSGQITGPLNNLVIANNSITSAKILDNTIGVTDINSGGNDKVLTTNATGTVNWMDKSSLTTDDQALSLSGNTLNIDNATGVNLNTLTSGGTQISGTLNNLSIIAGSVSTANLADNAVTGAKILDNTITTSDIQNGTIAAVDIANGIITAAKISSGGNDRILSTDAAGVVTWADRNALVTDPSPTNEVITTLSLTGNQFAITEGGNTTTQNFNSLTLTGDASGSINNTTVTRIQGNPVNGTSLTASDNGKLMVWNGTQWIAQTIAGVSPATQYYSVDPADFQVMKSIKDKYNISIFQGNSSFVTIHKPNEGSALIAGIHLPHNATLIAATLYYMDNAPGNISARLYSKSYSSGNTALTPLWTSSGASSTVNNINLMNTVGPVIIDNQSNTYRVEVDLDPAIEAEDVNSSTHRVYGLRISYTQ
jgi:hypothetical protein